MVRARGGCSARALAVAKQRQSRRRHRQGLRNPDALSLRMARGNDPSLYKAMQGTGASAWSSCTRRRRPPVSYSNTQSYLNSWGAQVCKFVSV